MTEIGKAVTTLWKDPRKLAEAQAHFLIEKHAEILSHAYHGTTLTLSGVWVAGVSDLTMGDYRQIKLPDLDSQLHIHAGHHQHFPTWALMVFEAGKGYWIHTLQLSLPNTSGYP